MRKTRPDRSADYKERISALQKRLQAAMEEHRRMRRELEALEDRDPYHLRRHRRLPHVDDGARN